MLHSTRSRPFCLALSAVAAEKLEHEGESASSSDEEEKKPEQDLYRVHVIHMYTRSALFTDLCPACCSDRDWHHTVSERGTCSACVRPRPSMHFRGEPLA